MSNFKGTPGPWTATDYVNDSNLYVCENGSNPIIEVYRARYEKDEVDRAKANAALIAQAPAMLEALLEARDFVRHMRTGAGHTNTELETKIAMIFAALREGGAI